MDFKGDVSAKLSSGDKRDFLVPNELLNSISEVLIEVWGMSDDRMETIVNVDVKDQTTRNSDLKDQKALNVDIDVKDQKTRKTQNIDIKDQTLKILDIDETIQNDDIVSTDEKENIPNDNLDNSIINSKEVCCLSKEKTGNGNNDRRPNNVFPDVANVSMFDDDGDIKNQSTPFPVVESQTSESTVNVNNPSTFASAPTVTSETPPIAAFTSPPTTMTETPATTTVNSLSALYTQLEAVNEQINNRYHILN